MRSGVSSPQHGHGGLRGDQENGDGQRTARCRGFYQGEIIQMASLRVQAEG